MEPKSLASWRPNKWPDTPASPSAPQGCRGKPLSPDSCVRSRSGLLRSVLTASHTIGGMWPWLLLAVSLAIPVATRVWAAGLPEWEGPRRERQWAWERARTQWNSHPRGPGSKPRRPIVEVIGVVADIAGIVGTVIALYLLIKHG
jgi:hypothetical protein